jgi:hypothetical protein
MGAIHKEAFMGASFPNIDISCRTGEYIGYSAGNDGIWFIKRANPIGSRYRWLAQRRDNKDCFYARTLGEISEKLLSLDNTATVTNC